MAAKKRRKFTSEFRATVVLEVISGRMTVAQAASKFKIMDGAIYEWRAAALERLPLLFEMKAPEQEGQERIAELAARWQWRFYDPVDVLRDCPMRRFVTCLLSRCFGIDFWRPF